MRYLGAQELLVIHSEIVDQTGGLHGVRDTGLLESISEKPKMRFTGKELYRGLFQKAAAYTQSLIQYHVFFDGNKRTGVAVAARFLFLNSYEFTASNKELEKFALEVALKKIEDSDMVKWLK